MATITTSTSTSALGLSPSASSIERDAKSGYLWALVRRSSSGAWGMFRSTNNGTSWADPGTGSDAVPSTALETSGVFIDADGYAHITYRTYGAVSGVTGNQDILWYRRGTPSSTRQAWTWNTATRLGYQSAASAGATLTGLDTVAFKHPKGGWVIFCAAGYTSGTSQGYRLYWALISTANVVTVQSAPSAAQNLGDVTGRTAPSLDFRHTGDGKTASSTPDVWVSHGKATSRVARHAWNGTNWTYGSVTVPAAPGATLDHRAARWDGTRFLVAQPSADDNTVPVVYERDASNTVWTTRVGLTHPQGVLRSVAITYLPTGDFIVYGVGTTDATVWQSQYSRASATWGPWVQVLATVLTSVGNYSVRRGASNSKIDTVTETGVTPFTIANQQAAVVRAPTAPTWTQTGVAKDNVAVDVNAALPLLWKFNDPDTADTQSAYALSRQIGTAAVAYWRASDSTWQTTEVKNPSSVASVTLPTGWGADADANHVFKVKTWDSADLSSPYGAAITLIPSAKSNPVLVQPLAGGVLPTSTYDIKWTNASQKEFRIVVSGQGDWDTGWIAGTEDKASSLHKVLGGSATPGFVFENGGSYKITLQTKNRESMLSDVVTVNVTVSYTLPALPTISLAPVSGGINVAVINPVPTGTQPFVVGIDLYRGDANGNGQIIARSGSDLLALTDYAVASGVDYYYWATLTGDNGASITSGPDGTFDVAGGNPAMHTLTENFPTATLDSTKWAPSTANVQPVVGSLRITPTTVYPTLQSKNRFNLNNSYLWAKVVCPTTGNGSFETELIAYADDNNRALIYVSGGGLAAQVRVAGVNTNLNFGAYNPVTHAYLRISQSGNQTLFATSPDGVAWTIQGRITSTLDVTAVAVQLQAGYYGTEAPGQYAVFDNINVTS